MSSPANSILPSVGSSSRRTVRPAVDLPQPDSPTRPTVSPARISSEIPSTARTAPAVRRRIPPPRIGKCFLRLVTRSSGSPVFEISALAAGAVWLTMRSSCRSAGQARLDLVLEDLLPLWAVDVAAHSVTGRRLQQVGLDRPALVPRHAVLEPAAGVEAAA